MTNNALLVFFIYLAIINIFAIFTVAYDKSISRLPRGSIKRIPERRFVIISALGGGFCVLLAMLIARHKTKKRSTLLLKIGCLFAIWSAIVFAVLLL